MTTQQLIEQIKKKKSFLCIGLDVDLNKIPEHLLKEEDPIFAFNKAIIDATHHLCVAYKPNTAFYEAYGIKGWQALEKTINYLNENYPDIFTIADAKRGDIGNTSTMYAKAFFEDLAFDSVTVAPYMGKDSVEPFLAFKNKHTIMLALTSNAGAFDFQTKTVEGKELYKQVLETSKTWENSENLMYVVGATKSKYMAYVRHVIPDAFLLVPGVGAQGGNLHDTCKYGMNDTVGLLVNSSRGIIYASKGKDFAEAAALEASELQVQMKIELKNYSNNGNLKKDINYVLGDIIEAIGVWEYSNTGEDTKKSEAIIEDAIATFDELIAKVNDKSIKNKKEQLKNVSQELEAKSKIFIDRINATIPKRAINN